MADGNNCWNVRGSVWERRGREVSKLDGGSAWERRRGERKGERKGEKRKVFEVDGEKIPVLDGGLDMQDK
ncbi:hypothetical protein N7512_005273 [Penicillium capsulatum]|nr:hypothetical protein N7512_005273 [Penicillium capsulatum]